VTSKAPVGKCGPYGITGVGGNHYVDTVDATYLFKVFEARTGRLVKEFSLRGSVDPCPSQVDVPSLPFARNVDTAAVIAQLRPIVERDF
jgi:hypothetical protein